MFALPMETAVPPNHRSSPIPINDIRSKGFAQARSDLIAAMSTGFHNEPPRDLSDVIHWVRVYKNPKTTRTSELGTHTAASGNLRQWNVPGVETGPSWVMSSLTWEQLEPGWDARGPDEVWVHFVSADDGGALIDTGENSGLVTADKNTTVKPGDRVAIAVNFTSWGGPGQTWQLAHT